MLPRLEVKCPSLEAFKPEAPSSPGQSPKLGSECKRPGALIMVLEQSTPETPSSHLTVLQNTTDYIGVGIHPRTALKKRSNLQMI